MATITIYRDSRRLGTCRSCGAPIEWAENTNGKAMPFDRPLVPVQTQAPLLGDRTVETIDTTATPTHFATCPDAAKWRKQKGSR